MWILKNVYLLTTHSHTSATDAMMMTFTVNNSDVLCLQNHCFCVLIWIYPFCFNVSKKTQITQQVYFYHTNIFKQTMISWALALSPRLVIAIIIII